MKRAIITIDEQGGVHFPNANADDIWMSTQQLVELLGKNNRYATLHPCKHN